jgi:hypothetical protein
VHQGPTRTSLQYLRHYITSMRIRHTVAYQLWSLYIQENSTIWSFYILQRKMLPELQFCHKNDSNWLHLKNYQDTIMNHDHIYIYPQKLLNMMNKMSIQGLQKADIILYSSAIRRRNRQKLTKPRTASRFFRCNDLFVCCRWLHISALRSTTCLLNLTIS